MDKSTILRYTTKFGEKQSMQFNPLFTLHFKYFHLRYQWNARLENLGTNFIVLINESSSPCEVNKGLPIFKIS
jgi:hypothetical protein